MTTQTSAFDKVRDFLLGYPEGQVTAEETLPGPMPTPQPDPSPGSPGEPAPGPSPMPGPTPGEPVPTPGDPVPTPGEPVPMPGEPGPGRPSDPGQPGQPGPPADGPVRMSETTGAPALSPDPVPTSSPEPVPEADPQVAGTGADASPAPPETEGSTEPAADTGSGT